MKRLIQLFKCGTILFAIVFLMPGVSSAQQVKSDQPLAPRTPPDPATQTVDPPDSTEHQVDRPVDDRPAEVPSGADQPVGQQEVGKEKAESPQPATDQGAVPTESIGALTVEQLKTELQGVQQQLRVSQETVSAEQGGSQEDQDRQVTLLHDLENAIQRRITALTRLDQLRKTVTGLETQLQDPTQLGLDAKPPYELSLLDSLRDELATVRREAEADALSLQACQDAVKQAEKRLEELERKRREVRDQLNQTNDESERASLQRQFTRTQTSQRTAEQELASAREQVQLSQLEQRSNELRLDLLEAKIARVQGHVVFTPAGKRKRLAELDVRRGDLERELQNLRRTDQVNQIRLDQARSALADAEGAEATQGLTDALASREALAKASNRGIELLQERINIIAVFKTLWERRFALTQDPSEAELTAWQKETETTLEDIRRRREQTEQQLQTLRLTKLDIENRLSTWNAAMGERSDMELRLKALQSGEKYAADYLASLLNLEQLAQRTADDIDQRRQLDSWRKYWSRFLYTANVYWGHELFVIHDHAFRLGELIWAAIVFCLVLVAGRVARIAIRRILLRRFSTRAEGSDVLLSGSLMAAARRTKPVFFVFLAAYLALMTLPLSDTSRRLLNSMAIIVLTLQVAIWGNAMLRGFIDRVKRRRMEEDPSAASAFGLMGFFSQVAIWSAATLLILTNLGYEIGPLLAGLGVGGVAVAFALQSILGDIFCSIAIVLDKPFVIGDFVIVNDLMGSVEHIGIKTTRIRSLSGEQIIFSNADLIGSRVRNYKRMYERRVVFEFGVVYETPLDKLQQIPATLRSIVEGLQQTRFDRGHFKGYGDFSLNFEIVYFVLTPDYNRYMDIQQEINLNLFAAFQDQGIAFAYPTREIIMRPCGDARVSTQPHAERSETQTS